MKTKTKLLGVLILLIATVFTASAYDFEVDGIYYNKTSDTEVEVTYGSSDSDNKYYYGRSVTIPASVTYNGTTYSVTEIGSGAFDGCYGLTSVTIPNSVTNIGNQAFYDCTSLTSVTIPNSVTNIGNQAFYDCTSLTSVTIPNSVKTIGYEAFYWCSGLTSVTIPNSVTAIGYQAFYKCSGLTSVTIPNSVTAIGYQAFYKCSGLTSVTIPNSVTNIGSYAFDGCSGLTSVHITDLAAWCKIEFGSSSANPLSNAHTLYLNGEKVTDLVIPKSTQIIKEFTFSGCSSFTSIAMPNSVTEIGDGAFYGCSGLKSVTIGAGVTSIGSDAFSTTNNTKINIPKVIWLGNTPPSSANNVSAKVNYVSNEQFSISNRKVYPFLSSKFEVDGVVYVPVSPSERTCDVIDCNYAPTSTDIVIDSIVSNKNVQLKVLEVNPYSFYDNDSITSLKIQNSGNIGDQAFYDCTKLESVTFGPKVTSIQESAFYNCKSLKSLTLPDNISSLGESSFENCSSLSNVSIGEGISSLPHEVFSGCSSLSSLTIPANIKYIGNYAFSGCTQLADVTFEGVNKDSSQISISLGSNGSSPLFASCPLDEVYIGRKLSYQTSSSYGYSPFYRNTSLRSVKISDIETQIYDNEFYGCSNLQEFSCGDGVTTIGSWAFSGCSAMTSFASGSKVKSIGQEAFSDCTGLTSFTSLAAVPPTCGNQALDDINKWECVLHVPAESIDDYQAAEQWKEFFFMEETQGVDDVITDAAAGEVVGYYNLQGIRSDEPWEGLNIVVYSDGTRRKIRY